MKIDYPAGVRREWFDRNPTVTNYAYLQVLGPHASTDRLTHNVGAGRLAFCQIAGLTTERVTAAAPVDFVSVAFVFSNGATLITPARLWYSDNTTLKVYMTSFVFDLYGKAGSTFKIATADLSTGGTVLYDLSMSVVEFDA